MHKPGGDRTNSHTSAPMKMIHWKPVMTQFVDEPQLSWHGISPFYNLLFKKLGPVDIKVGRKADGWLLGK
jgi:hypothetical protein